MKKISLLLIPIVAGLAFYLFFSGHSRPKYVFLITLDTTRADYVDYSLVNNGRTPNLAGLAAAGRHYNNAYSVIPITFPSHAAMFYSLPPHVFKIFNNGQERVIPYPALAEIMKKNGYATGAVVSLAVLGKKFGLNKGFDHYLDNFPAGLWYKTAAEVNRDAFSLIDQMKHKKAFFWIHYADPHEPYFPPGDKEEFTVFCNEIPVYASLSIQQPVVRLVLTLKPGKNLIRLHSEIPAAIREKQAFVGIGYTDLRLRSVESGEDLILTRSPDLVLRSERYGLAAINTTQSESYLAVVNEGKTSRQAELSFKYQLKADDEAKKNGYEKEIGYMDAQLGVLLDYLKKENLFEDAVFLVMGDHGEGLGEYQSHFGHIHYLNKVYTHVPFIISGKGVSSLPAQNTLVSNFNVAPTLLSLIGARKPSHMEGNDVLTGKPDTKLFLETYSPEAFFDAFSVVHFPWQVIFYPGRSGNSLEFFDLEQDRFGITNLQLAPDPSRQRSAMTNSVLKISRIITANKRKQESLNQKTMDTLKSLGYL